MRLLFLSNVFPSPVHPAKGVFNLGLVRACVQLQHEVSVVVPIAWTDWIRTSRARRQAARQPTDFLPDVPARYPVYYYTPGIFRSAYGQFMWRGIRASVVDLVGRQRPQVILAYWAHPDGECAIRAAKAAGIPSVVITGGSDVLLLTADAKRRRAVYGVLQGADLVIAVSQDLKRKVVEGGIDEDKVHVVRRGIDTERFHPGNRQAARLRLGIDADRRLLLWVGRMESVKGLPVLLEAIQRLKVECVDFDTVLIGTGAALAATSAEIQRRGLAGCVKLAGAVPHAKLADYYRAADLSVLPSLSEGVPNVLLESIACGTPFVASHVGGIPEIASPGVDHLVPPSEPQALAAAIREQLSTSSPNGPRTFLPEDWPTAAAKLIDIISPLVNSDPPSPHGVQACLTTPIA